MLEEQPIYNDEIMVQWNGEIFSGVPLDEKLSDTRILFEKLKEDTDSFIDVLSMIIGPWAIVIFDRIKNTVYFGRDALGRQSLLLNEFDNHDSFGFILSSIAEIENYAGWKEVKYGFLYNAKLSNYSAGKSFEIIPLKLNYRFVVSSKISKPSDTQIVLGLFHLLITETTRCRLIEKGNVESISLLFSGGIDCTIIACILANIIDSKTTIDILNVQFEMLTDEESADRKQARKVFAYLTKEYSNVKFRFMNVDVSKNEYLKAKKRVATLLYPSDNKMDLSIGIALWFACQGETSARIVFTGSGADELFAGYKRHLTYANHEDSSYLSYSLQEEIDRIGYRNLGRDERCISDNGKEARLPYMDERLVDFVCKLPINYKINLDAEENFRNKWVLRKYAKEFLDLPDWIAGANKRAIQFGSNSAKVEGHSKSGYEKIDAWMQ